MTKVLIRISNISYDLARDKIITKWMDKYFYSKLNEYTTHRPEELNDSERVKLAQKQGIDITLKDVSEKLYYVDEKSQTHYLNENIPSFAFEIFYYKKRHLKIGWLFDESKKTNYYILIYPNTVPKVHYTELVDVEQLDNVKVYLIEKEKLLNEIYNAGLTRASILEEAGKLMTEGTPVPILNIPVYKMSLFKSDKYAESPTNLVVKKKILDKVAEKNWLVTKTRVKEIS